MTHTNDFEIIIIGGGPAGTSAALSIAERAPQLIDKMLVIEAKDYPRDKLCGGGITFHGEEQLARLGIAPQIESFAIHQLIFRLNGQHFRVPFDHAMRIIQRAEFDAALADAVQRKGIALHTGEKLREIQHTANGVELLTDAAHYHAKVVIGADGANSTVRRKLKFHSEEGVARLLRILTPIDTQTNELWRSETAVFDFSCVSNGIQGYMWDFPSVKDGQPVMNRGIFDSRIVPEAIDKDALRHGNLKQTFGEWLSDSRVDLDEYPLRGHPVRWFSPEAEFSQPHVLLAGDAAGVDALFAEGISYAMEYGDLVTDALCEAYQRDDFSFTAYREQLLASQLGSLLRRRAWAAQQLYLYKVPPFWRVFWWFASIAPRWMQHAVGAWMAVLPGWSASAHGTSAVPELPHSARRPSL